MKSFVVSPDQPIATLNELRIGEALPFAREAMSAINKQPRTLRLPVTQFGIQGDEQADRKHHGGINKAVHQLPPDNYALIESKFNVPARVGSLGENLSTLPVNGFTAMLESSVCIGDIYSIGSVQLQVVQPRRPCYKINDQLGQAKVASWLASLGRTGWYYRVVQSGELAAGDSVFLLERNHPFATLSRLWQLANRQVDFEDGELAKWLGIPCLHESWKKVLSKR